MENRIGSNWSLASQASAMSYASAAATANPQALPLKDARLIAIKQAVMLKSGRYIQSNWHSRIFVLTPEALFYYEEKLPTRPSGFIRIGDIREVKATDTAKVDRPHCFVIRTTSTFFYIKADTEKDMEEWIQAIIVLQASPRPSTPVKSGGGSPRTPPPRTSAGAPPDTGHPLTAGVRRSSTQIPLRASRKESPLYGALDTASGSPDVQGRRMTMDIDESDSEMNVAADGSSGFRLEPPTSGSGTLAGSDEATSFLEGSWRLDFMRQERRSVSQEGQSGPRRQYVLSFAQHAIWHQRQKVLDRTNEIIALVAQAESVVDKECLRVAVADLVARHPALRTTFQSHVSAVGTTTLTQIVHEDALAGLEAIMVNGFNDEELEAHVQAEAYEPMDMTRGPLFRAQLYTGDSSTSAFFVMSVHTLVADLPSLLILLDDLRVLYSYNFTAAKSMRSRQSMATVLQDETDMSDVESGYPDIPSYRFRTYSALFDDRRASQPRRASQASVLSGRSGSRMTRSGSLAVPGSGGSLPSVPSPLNVPSTRSIETVQEDVVEFEDEAADVPADLTKDGFQIRKSLTRSTTAPSVSASPSRRTSYVAPSGASSANVLPYGDGFERLVGSTERTLARHENDNDIRYWFMRIRGVEELSVLELPADGSKRRPAKLGTGCVNVKMKSDIYTRLSRIARTAGVPLRSVLLSGWICLMYRYTGQNDLVVGSKLSCRDGPDERQAVGVFETTMPVRVDMGRIHTYRELMLQTARELHNAHVHRNAPLHLVEEHVMGEAAEGTGRTAPFNVVFTHRRPARLFSEGIGRFLYGPAGSELRLDTLRLRSIKAREGRYKSPYDLEFESVTSNGTLYANIHFNTGVLSAETVERIWSHYMTLMGHIADRRDLNARVTYLPVLPPAERVLLNRWNETRQEHPDALIHELFERACEKTPAALAVESAEASMSYAELNGAANMLAHRLRAMGVGVDSAVGLCVPRSLHTAVAVLAILKAGGAYVPLDPAYPAARLEFMVKDSGTTALLTTRALAATMQWPDNVSVICMDEPAENENGAGVTGNPPRLAKSTMDSAAYIVYTSGSTGVPKGVCMPHLPLTNLVYWQCSSTGNSDVSRPKTLQFAPVSFDVHFQEMFTTWHRSGAVVMITEEMRLDTESMLEYIEKKSVNSLYLPFVALQQLCEVAVSMGKFPACLREIRTAGEQLQISEAVSKFFRKLPTCILVNDYGPSETHVVTSYRLPRSRDLWPPLPPIGVPVSNTQLYILDSHGNRVPIGVAGELVIAGECLARGYMNRADVTATKFRPIPDPNDLHNARAPPPPYAITGPRAYFTGDLCRYGSDGAIYYLGRIDSQVKIRGYRVEPGEIETVIGQHTDIRKAAVVVRTLPTGDKQLVAYFVPASKDDGKPALTAAELKEYLSTRLAEYMVPACFVQMASLPLTPSGKVDRRHLPDPDDVGHEERGQGARNELEAEVARAIGEILGRPAESLSVDDNFFNLGGHSLLATRLVARLNKALQIRIPVSRLYENPTIAGIASIASALSTRSLTRKNTSLSRKSTEAGMPTAILELATLRRLKSQAMTGVLQYPASHGQRSMWLASQANIEEGSNQANNIAFAVRAEGAVDVGTLQYALQGLVDAHAALRTVFTVGEDGALWALQMPHQDVLLTIVNAKGWTDERLKDALSDDAAIKIDLAKGPISHMKLYQRSGSECVLSVVVHHIAVDLWSLVVLIREFFELYRLLKETGSQPAPRDSDSGSAVEYVDYSEWERRLLADPASDEMLRYWMQVLDFVMSNGSHSNRVTVTPDRDVASASRVLRSIPGNQMELEDDLPVLNMTPDKPRPALQTFNGSEVWFELPAEVVVAVDRMARTERTTQFTVLLAAYYALLYRYTSQTDIVVGTPMASRGLPELDDVVGYFINPVAIRVRLEKTEGFRQLIGHVREKVVGGLAHKDCPFPTIVQALMEHHPRDPSRPSVFQAMFVVQQPHQMFETGVGSLLGNDVHQPLDFGCDGVTLKTLPMERRYSQFELALIMVPRPDGTIAGKIEYNTDIFNVSTMEEFAAHYAILLDSMLRDHDQPISHARLLSDADAQHLIHSVGVGQEGLGGPRDQYELGAPVHELFERHAAADPDAPAVVDAVTGEALTYRELNERADDLAEWLRLRFGLAPETLVAICLERSPLLLVCILAVLKAGLAYVPIDPSYPRDRVTYMLTDSRAPVLLTSQALALHAPPTVRCAHVHADTRAKCGCCPAMYAVGADDKPCARAGRDRPGPVAVSPQQLAYCIYTSGSTGTPKGVLIEHRALTVFAQWQRDHYGYKPRDRSCMVAGPGFDAAVAEIWSSLVSGGSLHIPSNELRLQPDKLKTWLQEARITVCYLPTPLCRAVLETPWPKETTLRVMYTGGEALIGKDFKRYPFELHNAYGPTENTVATSCYTVPIGSVRPPIGTPAGGCRLYVLDHDMQLVPVAVPGELFVGGIKLARGYLNRPELTAAKFVDDPFHPGGKMYGTGDLVRVLPSGDIDFIGRIDSQVKIRGYRVELGEIQQRIAQHPHVLEALVTVRESKTGKVLVAYMIADQSAFSVKELRSYLRQSLPDYMIPSAFVLLQRFPMTANGKVDLRALPAADVATAFDDSGVVVGARTPTEMILGDIWSALLGCNIINVFANFFDMGGHSLTVAQLISRIRAELQVELSLAKVFQSPTVASLAEVVDMERAALGLPPLKPPKPEIPASPAPLRHAAVPMLEQPPSRRLSDNSAGSYELSYNQESMWVMYRTDPSSAAYNVAFACKITSSLDANALRAAFQMIVDRHSCLRTTYTQGRSGPVQILHDNVTVDFKVEQGAANPSDWLDVEVHRPFDIEHRSPFRVRLLAVPDGHYLMIAGHHITLDLWSLTLILSDMSKCYSRALDGIDVPVPPPSVQYYQYAQQQRQLMNSPDGDRLIEYWERQLCGELPIMELSTKARPVLQTTRGDVYHFTLPAGVAEQLRGIAREEGTTLYTVLAAAFSAFLSRSCGGLDDIIIGTPVSCRNTTQLEDIVGFFVNTVALRIKVATSAGAPSLADLVHNAHDTVLDALEHADCPFSCVVDALKIARDPSRSPIFQVMFVYESSYSTHTNQNVNLAPFTMGRTGHAVQFGRLEIESLDVVQRVAPYDLSLVVSEGVERGPLDMTWQYNTDLFDKAHVARLADHLTAFYTAAASAPQKRISELPLMSANERRLLVEEWNTTAMAVPNECLHELFEAQAASRPGAVAVCETPQGTSPGATWTFQMLNERANQLAHVIRAAIDWSAVENGRLPLVGVMCERSPWLILSMLATWKAGAAFICIDPAYPADRVQYMLKDADAFAVLTQSKFVVGQGAAAAIFVDEMWQESGSSPAADHGSGNLGIPVKKSDLAYCVYTSGSTGMPKGCLIEHCNILNVVWWQRTYYRYTPEDRSTHIVGPGFDPIMIEIWPVLLAGGSLYVVPEELRLTGLGLAAWMAEHAITTALLPTPLAELFLQDLSALPADAPLRLIRTGGEKLHNNPPSGAKFAFHNEYGPAECTVMCAQKPLSHDSHLPPPVGRPIGNARLYIVDSNMQPVPVGVMGELLIGGHGVGRGYLNRPDLTAQKFIPDPFVAGVKNARVYRTGDQARYLPSGDVEILGRIDNQVKLRGHRVELGEIEAQLLKHESVKEAVVVLSPNGQQLYAYLVASPGSKLSVRHLKAHLGATLPAYMVPSLFIVCDALPYTANGKVDRKALPSPDSCDVQADKSLVLPATKVERVIFEMWRDVLKTAAFGVTDSFFDVGGHSLAATQLMTKIRRAFNVDLPLAAFFVKPTIRELARLVDGLTHGDDVIAQEPSPAELEREAVLPDDIVAAMNSASGLVVGDGARTIFLTGVTGYLGAFMLAVILDRLPQASVYCLVRAGSVEQGLQRIRSNMEQYGVWKRGYEASILPLIGEMSLPKLGLGDDTWASLATEIDMIIHSASLVHFLYPYELLKDANVRGTVELLRLAVTHRLKPLHAISTLSVFGEGRGPGRPLMEDDDLAGLKVHGGYSQSKWVADRILIKAQKKGLPVAIYRPGRVTGSTVTGIGNPDDYFSCLLRGCVAMGAFPDYGEALDLVPVDFVATLIVHVAMAKDSQIWHGRTFHLANPEPVQWSDAVAWLYDALGGERGALLPPKEWAHKLMALCREGKAGNNPLARFVSLFEDNTGHDNGELLADVTNANAAVFDTDSMPCPVITPEIMAKYVDFMVEHGYMQARPAAAS